MGEGGVWNVNGVGANWIFEPFANTWFGELMLPEDIRAVQGLVIFWEMRELDENNSGVGSPL